MKPREPLCYNHENTSVDYRNQQHSQHLATVATLEAIADKSVKSITSTLLQYFLYACAGVGICCKNTKAIFYITHVELLLCVDVIEFIDIKVLLQLLQSVASVAAYRANITHSLFTSPPVIGTVQSFDGLRAGATPENRQSNCFKNSVVRVVRVDAWLSRVNAHG